MLKAKTAKYNCSSFPVGGSILQHKCTVINCNVLAMAGNSAAIYLALEPASICCSLQLTSQVLLEADGFEHQPNTYTHQSIYVSKQILELSVLVSVTAPNVIARGILGFQQHLCPRVSNNLILILHWACCFYGFSSLCLPHCSYFRGERKGNF